MWSFIGNKKRQRWLWYAWEPRLKRIIAHVFGSRSKKTLGKLLKLLSGFRIAFWCTDGYRALMNPLIILIEIIKLRYIHILSYVQMVSRKINNRTTRCANSIFYTTLFTNSAPNYT